MINKTRSIVISVAFITALGLSSTGALGAMIEFDDAGPSGGTISYNGDEGVGTLNGALIPFDTITGTGGTPLTCVGCILTFSTGANLTEPQIGDPFNAWTFGGGSTSSISIFGGTSGALLLPGGTELLTGTFSNAGNISVQSSGSTLQIIASGIDVKNSSLANHFGGQINPFEFSITAQLNPVVFDETTGSFTGTVANVDLINNPVPIPNAALLMGTGIMGLILIRRRVQN